MKNIHIIHSILSIGTGTWHSASLRPGHGTSPFFRCSHYNNLLVACRGLGPVTSFAHAHFGQGTTLAYIIQTSTLYQMLLAFPHPATQNREGGGDGGDFTPRSKQFLFFCC